MTRFLWAVAGCLGLLLGCESDANDGSGGSSGAGGGGNTAGVGGTGGTAGVGGVGGTAGVGGDGPRGYDEVQACGGEDHCLPSFAQLVENSIRNVSVLERTRCVLESLKERREGRYAHEADETNSCCSTNSGHAFQVLADGTVYYARRDYGGGMSPIDDYDRQSEPMRCEVADASYFDTCLEAIDRFAPEQRPGIEPPDDVWRCVYEDPRLDSLPWLKNCEPIALSCESEDARSSGGD
ncbi:MAG: hypothetical protein KIT72_02030 [Polyangiaceae bacterium]|nr:hypothetical protein [Polyangiaceae bacterium]MCW5789177.1 hypothetical protein [Polyangiaceae bacterium]